MDEIIRDQVIELLKYLYFNKKIKKANGILGLGSIDYKVAEKCAELYLNGYGDYIVFTGNCGKGTEGIITQTEAENFRDVAIKKGVPEDKIYLEKQATNTYENYIFADTIIRENNLIANSLIVVQKPYVERRSLAISKQFFPNKKFYITSPSFDIIHFEEYYKDNKHTNTFEMINEIVAEIDIIKKVPDLKLQIYQEIPEKIEKLYLDMINRGFDKYLVREELKDKLLKLKNNKEFSHINFN